MMVISGIIQYVLATLGEKFLEKIDLDKNRSSPKISGAGARTISFHQNWGDSAYRSRKAFTIPQAKNAFDDNLFHPEIREEFIVQSTKLSGGTWN